MSVLEWIEAGTMAACVVFLIAAPAWLIWRTRLRG